MKTFNLEEYLKDLQQIVNMDSGSRIPGGTGRVASFFEEKYNKLGLEIKTFQFSSEVGPCLQIRNRPEAEKIDVLLLGHMDTVFPDGEVSRRPYTESEAVVFGPGVADMKGGLVSIYYLVKQLLEEQVNISFCVALNSDEEISSTHSQEWLKSLARISSLALVMEPGRKNGEFVVERKGLARYVVKIDGVAAHAGVDPQNGASAIHEMARVITELAGLNCYSVGTSVNVGIISGGTVANVVCDYAEGQVDTRFDRIEEHIKIEEAFKKLSLSPSDSRLRISYNRAGFRPPMIKTAETEGIMRLMEQIGAETGMEVKWCKTGGGSDGNFVAFEGCTVIDGAGPTGDKVHSPDEYLRVNTVEERIRLLHDLIIRLSERDG